jgi:hypothetical protein
MMMWAKSSKLGVPRVGFVAPWARGAVIAGGRSGSFVERAKQFELA